MYKKYDELPSHIGSGKLLDKVIQYQYRKFEKKTAIRIYYAYPDGIV